MLLWHVGGGLQRAGPNDISIYVDGLVWGEVCSDGFFYCALCIPVDLWGVKC